MDLGEQSSFYDVLDLKPDATTQEIRDAYLRSKATFSKDNVALYTLISTEEREDTLKKIEEAYQILSNPDKRRVYDQQYGSLSLENDFQDKPQTLNLDANDDGKVVSIDRFPPMESSSSEEDLLIAPSTDFDRRSETREASRVAPPPRTPTHHAPPVGMPPRAPHAPAAPPANSPIDQEILNEVEWRGTALRKVREFRKVSIEEMCSFTKITKTYLLAIEEENFTKLPAPVFVRGFVMQISRVLKLPAEKVSAAYMARFYQARPEK